MATKRMLIDASHPEETRVVVVDGTRVEDYDVEVASRRQLKGNIYLAKVTRVEPSLQAAFVDYGGNRHGFLAFNEIHPDYYQIPIADRERLLAEQAAAERAAESIDREADDAEAAEAIAVDDEDDVERRRTRPPSRYYKIQEVVKRRQIMLVQVAKEERGNKGAALTTYLSLAGRYCVLMPNTSRGGGISRKIAGANDRKRLKKILAELEVPEGMAVIVRTAGSGRSKAEIKRDYEYLVRLWSSIREITLQSTAPTLVYEEASLIKRSIRDLYGRDIEEIIVQGEEEYRIAKEFMKLFISSHAKRVKLYENCEKPLFQQFGVEEHLDSMHQPIVQLRSGGYIVINPTEALVAIDVNSGRSTRERNIEETALRTNLEAADEIARQLRLRDLAGLIVVDFIDMENPRNQGMVERRLKEAMKDDRARVQIGRISPFGLLELSRQRLRPSLIETCFEVCPACGGNGLRRTTESTALAILRKLEEEGIKHRAGELSVTMPSAVAMYLLNQKRHSLVTIEARYGMSIGIVVDPALVPPDHYIERRKPVAARAEDETATAEEEPEAEADTERAGEETITAEHEDGGKRGRRRRPRRKRRGEEEPRPAQEIEVDLEAEGKVEAAEEAGEEAAGDEPEPGAETEESSAQSVRKRRRRGKRGGRRRVRIEPGEQVSMDVASPAAAEPVFSPADEDANDDEGAFEDDTDEDADGDVAEVGQGARFDGVQDEEEEEPVDAVRDPDSLEATSNDHAATDVTPGHAAQASRRLDIRIRSGEHSGAEVHTPAEAASEDAYASASPTTDGGEGEPALDAGADTPLSDEDQDAAEANDVVVVGGTRPLIEEPDTLESPSGPQDGTVYIPEESQPKLPASTGQANSRRPGEGVEIAVIDGARPPLADNDGDGTAMPGEAPQSVTEELNLAHHEGHGQGEAAFERQGHTGPKPAYEGGDTQSVAQPNQGLASAPNTGDESARSGSSTEESQLLPEKAQRTKVIRVGEGGDRGGADEPRRGWWQRLLS